MAFKAMITFASRNREDLDQFIQHTVEFGLMGCGIHTIDGTPTEEYEDPDIDYEDDTDTPDDYEEVETP